MTVDTEGHLYVASSAGLQICDQPGRVVAILNQPQNAPLSNVVLGGPNFDTLYDNQQRQSVPPAYTKNGRDEERLLRLIELQKFARELQRAGKQAKDEVSRQGAKSQRTQERPGDDDGDG